MPRITKPTEEGKRDPLNVRVTRKIREQLQAAAAANGRSLAQEVEFRMEQSFKIDQAAVAEETMRKLQDLISVMAKKIAAGELPPPEAWQGLAEAAERGQAHRKGKGQ
jgi:hypothetical protein